MTPRVVVGRLVLLLAIAAAFAPTAAGAGAWDSSAQVYTCNPGDTRVSIIGKGLTSFDATTNLRNCAAVTYLVLLDNAITALHADAFRGLGQLTRLYLRHNGITALHADALRGLGNLTKLWLFNNRLTTLPRGALRDLSKLTALYLSGNRLTTLTRDTLRGLGQLTKIDLRRNDISFVDPGFLASLPRDLDLDLGGNPTSSCNITAQTCQCARDRLSNDPKALLSRGPNGDACLCPAGQLMAVDTLGANFCQPCQRGRYSDTPGATECLRCVTNFTLGDGSISMDNCTEDPAIVQLQLEAAEAEAAEQEARAAEQEARADQRKGYMIMGGSAMLLVLMMSFCVCWFQRSAADSAAAHESEVHELELALQEADKKVLRNQLSFFRDWRIKETDLEIQEPPIAQGSEGAVYRGTLRGSTEVVAIKKARFETMTDEWDEPEVAFLMSLQHERLVKFIGAGHMFDEKNEGNVLFSVVEFMSGGALHSRLWGEPLDSVTWQERIRWASDAAEGLLYIHANGFTHRDIKSQNILYCKESGRAKVADFGTSRRQLVDVSSGNIRESSELIRTQTGGAAGTMQYLPPETDACDKYAFGITMHEMLTHEKPWHQIRSHLEIGRQVAQGCRPAVTAAQEAEAQAGWCDLMRRCWSQDAADRPSFDVVCRELDGMVHTRKADNCGTIPWYARMPPTTRQAATERAGNRSNRVELSDLRPTPSGKRANDVYIVST